VIRIAQQAARGAAGDCVFPGLRRSLWQSPRLRERAVLGESRRPSRSHGSRGRRPAAASSASLGGSTSSPLDALQPRGLEIAFHRVGQRRSGCGATGSLRVVDGRRLMRAGTEPRALRRSRARRGSRSPAAMGGQSFGNSPRMLCTPASLVGAVVAEVRVQRCQDDTATSERVAKGCVPRELIGRPPRRSGEGRSLSSITRVSRPCMRGDSGRQRLQYLVDPVGDGPVAWVKQHQLLLDANGPSAFAGRRAPTRPAPRLGSLAAARPTAHPSAVPANSRTIGGGPSGRGPNAPALQHAGVVPGHGCGGLDAKRREDPRTVRKRSGGRRN
jgi:hypothetical protein